jgi:DNA-binding IclR family transcriptional regulator
LKHAEAARRRWASAPRPSLESVARCVAEHGPLPVIAVAWHVGLSRAQANRLVAALIAQGRLTREGWRISAA